MRQGESPLGMMQPATRRPGAAPVRTRRHRWPILALVIAIIGIAIVWTVLWYVAASTADRTLSAWVDREAAAGRTYACGAQSIGGFPLGIHARCSNATAEIKNSEPPYAIAAKDIDFSAQIYNPTRLIGDVTGPVTLAPLGRSPSLAANWSRARIVVTGVPPNPDRLSIELTAPQLERIGDGEPLFKAKRTDLYARIVGGSPQDRPVIELTLHAAGAIAPTLHALLAQPTDTDIDTIVRGLKDLSPKPWAQRLREIQASGGGFEIKSLRMTQPGSIVVGAGTLTLNANGKLDGVVRVAVVGLEQIVPLIGIDRMLGQSLGQLSVGNGTLERLVPGLSETIRTTTTATLIDNLKKMGEPTSIDNQPAVVLPLRFADGAIYLGMLRIGEAPALF